MTFCLPPINVLEDYLFKPKKLITQLCHSIGPYLLEGQDLSRFKYPYQVYHCQFFKGHEKLYGPICAILLRDPNNPKSIYQSAQWIHPDYAVHHKITITNIL